MKAGILRFRHTLESHGKALNATLWVVQVLLAVIFAMAGSAKCFQPLYLLAEGMPWVNDVSGNLVRFIGIVELLGAVGLLLPALTRVMPELTSLAAFGLAVTMALATGFHLMREEFSQAPMPLFLGLMAAFVAWARMGIAPVLPRGRGA